MKKIMYENILEDPQDPEDSIMKKIMHENILEDPQNPRKSPLGFVGGCTKIRSRG